MLDSRWLRFRLLCLLVSLTFAWDADAWQHLCLTEAQSYEEWQLAHCTNHALKSEGAVCRTQNRPGASWQDCSQIAEGTSEIAWDVSGYPARLEIRFPRERSISAFAWWRFLDRGTDAYGPGTYSIEVSSDGESWKWVAGKFQNPWLGRNIHCFPEVKARAIALVLLSPLLPPHPRTILVKAGVYNLAEARAGNSVQDPPWFNDRYRYRAPINDAQAPGGKKDLHRRWADLTALVGERYRQAPEPHSLTVVGCVAGPTQLLQQECLTTFMPDARFDPAREAVGTVVWRTSRGAQSDEGSRWVYLNAATNQTSPGQPVSPAVSGKVFLPLYNYRRGMVIPCRVTLQNRLDAPIAGQVNLAVMDDDLEVRQKVFEVNLAAKATQELKWALDTVSLAAKPYSLECKLVSATGVQWAASAAFEIVPRQSPDLLFGLYGLPRGTRMQVIRYLEDARKHGVTLDNGHYNGGNSAFYFDMAAACGVNVAPCAHESLWPYGLPKGATPQQAENGAASDWPCFRDPTTREWAKTNLLGVLDDLRRYPAFCDRLGFHDDVTMRTVSAGKESYLTCYCPLCREAFKQQTGLEPPIRTQVRWTGAIIEDDDPWLRWHIFRVRDCYADYTKKLADVIGRTAPEVKLGSFVVKNLNPLAGLNAYYHMAPCGAVSCYDYPRATGTDANAFFMRQSGLMGNRQKETWMLNWIGGDPSLAMGTETASPGEVRCQFWNMLAAGNHIISFFRYGEPGTRYCIEGTEALEELGRVGAITRKVGPLFLAARPAASKVAVLCSYTDYCGSLLSDMGGWWNVRASLRNAFFAAFEENLSPEILAEEELIAGQTGNYQAIIVPNIRFLRKRAVAELEKQAAQERCVLINANSPISIRGAVRCSTSQDLARSARKAIGSPSLDPEASQVTAQQFVAPGLTMFVLVNQATGADRIKARYAKAKPVTLAAAVVDQKAAYYDLLAGKALPSLGGRLPINLPAAGGSIVVAYDQPVGEVQIELKESVIQEDTQQLICRVKTKAGKVSDGTHLVEVAVSNPEGESAEYSQRVVAERGTATVPIPIAINDPAGPWKVTVREVASSVSAAASFNVRAKHTGR